eukprot:7848851-Lingulodinium_polyedra.AAC.1
MPPAKVLAASCFFPANLLFCICQHPSKVLAHRGHRKQSMWAFSHPDEVQSRITLVSSTFKVTAHVGQEEIAGTHHLLGRLAAAAVTQTSTSQ